MFLEILGRQPFRVAESSGRSVFLHVMRQGAGGRVTVVVFKVHVLRLPRT